MHGNFVLSFDKQLRRNIKASFLATQEMDHKPQLKSTAFFSLFLSALKRSSSDSHLMHPEEFLLSVHTYAMQF